LQAEICGILKSEFVYTAPAPVGVFSNHPEDLAMPDSEVSAKLDEVFAKLDKVIELSEELAQRVGRGCRSPLMPRGGPDRYVARKVTAKDLWL
jgi:hypothetical protein